MRPFFAAGSGFFAAGTRIIEAELQMLVASPARDRAIPTLIYHANVTFALRSRL
jgi:hypothetical protein